MAREQDLLQYLVYTYIYKSRVWMSLESEKLG